MTSRRLIIARPSPRPATAPFADNKFTTSAGGETGALGHLASVGTIRESRLEGARRTPSGFRRVACPWRRAHDGGSRPDPVAVFPERAKRLFPGEDPFAPHPRLAEYWRAIAADPV